MSGRDKPVRWAVATPRTPPWGRRARVDVGVLLRQLQKSERIPMPHSRPTPAIGRRVHELRVVDGETRRSWRVVYQMSDDEILVLHWFDKTTRATPHAVITLCRRRLSRYRRG